MTDVTNDWKLKIWLKREMLRRSLKSCLRDGTEIVCFVVRKTSWEKKKTKTDISQSFSRNSRGGCKVCKVHVLTDSWEVPWLITDLTSVNSVDNAESDLNRFGLKHTNSTSSSSHSCANALLPLCCHLKERYRHSKATQVSPPTPKQFTSSPDTNLSRSYHTQRYMLCWYGNKYTAKYNSQRTKIKSDTPEPTEPSSTVSWLNIWLGSCPQYQLLVHQFTN